MTVIINGTTGITNVNGTAAAPAETGTDTDSGIVYGTNTVSLVTNGTTALTVDASQNVGIGNTTIRNKLDVVGNEGIYSTSATSVGSPLGAQVYIGDSNYNTSGYYNAAPGFGAVYDATYSSSAALAFYTFAGTVNSRAERMRIDSSGNLLVGTTTATGVGLTLGNQASNSGVPYIIFKKSLSGTVLVQYFYYNATGIGSIQCTDTATSYVTTSDYRLKEEIAPMTGALAKVAQLKPVTYKWKSNGSDGDGFIAHELAEVCPHAVCGEKDAVDADGNIVSQGIDTSFLVATLTAAIQEQQALITALTARITALENK